MVHAARLMCACRSASDLFISTAIACSGMALFWRVLGQLQPGRGCSPLSGVTAFLIWLPPLVSSCFLYPAPALGQHPPGHKEVKCLRLVAACGCFAYGLVLCLRRRCCLRLLLFCTCPPLCPGALWPMPAWVWRDVRFFFYFFFAAFVLVMGMSCAVCYVLAYVHLPGYPAINLRRLQMRPC